MARSWLSITVELVEGRGEYHWPRPGRVLVARRSMTFADLAEAIDTAFARWDRAHLHQFVLADGTRVVHLAHWWGEEPQGAIDDEVSLARLAAGEQFAYEFDIGDGWRHLCTVAARRVDPVEEVGLQPDRPIPVWGWGDLPDQYGRLSADDESAPPPQPDPPTGDLPPLLPTWGDWTPPEGQIAVDVAAFGRIREWDRDSESGLRSAIDRRDVDEVVQLLLSHDALELAHLAGDGLRLALAEHDSAAFVIARALAEDLRLRLEPGDAVLADQLDAARGAGPAPELRAAVVDLDELVDHLEGDTAHGEGWRLDVRTGRWWPEDPLGMVGEAPPPHWEDDDRWVHTTGLAIADSHDSWEDMQRFAGELEDGEMGDRLLAAIDGPGAFRRFRRVLEDQPDEVLRHWLRFRDERRRGRARSWLAMAGWMAVPRAD